MKKSERLKVTRKVIAMPSMVEGVTASALSDSTGMDLKLAKKSLHELWLAGEVIRKTHNTGEYLYLKKG